MKGATIPGFVFSYINGFGKEQLAMGSFGRSRTKAKQKLGSLNNNGERLEHIKPHKLYAVQVTAVDEVTKENT